jgi:hypothetical protein
MIEWCAVAMGGEGHVIVGDCPLQGCRFERLLESVGMRGVLDDVARRYPRLRIEVSDWRLTVLEHGFGGEGRSTCGRQVSRETVAEITRHYCELDAGRSSFLEDIVEYADRFRVTMYKPSLLGQHHRPGMHRYLIRKDVLEADLLVNLPKMKTHEKAGLTGAMKNLIGINGHKEYLPHHIKGAYFSGGDCYSRHNWFASWAEEIYDRWWETYDDLTRGRQWLYEKTYFLLKVAARLTNSDHIAPGSWPGNETIWRTTLDLNHLLYFGARGPKHVLNVVDGVVAGEGEGPLSAIAKPAGVLLAGENPACLDAAIAKLMGYNLSRVPTVYHAVYHRKSKFGVSSLEDVPLHFVDEKGKVRTGSWDEIENLGFKPPRNWKRALSIPHRPSRGGPDAI